MSTATEPKVTAQVPVDDPTSLLPKKLMRSRPLFDPEIVRRATASSFVKLNPITLALNAIRDALLGGAGWGPTLKAIAVLLPVAGITLAAGVWAFRAALRREQRRGTLGLY